MKTKITYYVATSMDGFIATPDGGVDWLSPYEGTGEDYGYKAFYEKLDVLLLGSRTYQQVLSFGEWPYHGKPCWVFSKRPLEIIEPTVRVTDISPREALVELETSNFENAWLVGGAALAGSFRSQRLIDEYIITIIPTILGGGIPLFSTSGPTEGLELVSSEAYESGLVQLRYVRGD